MWRYLAGGGALAAAVGAGVLEDYSHLAEGLLALYETTFDERWFTLARAPEDRSSVNQDA